MTIPAPIDTVRQANRTGTGGSLVLALGNPLRGDDGVGAVVLAALADESLPDGVDLLDGGTPGLETALLMQGYDRVLVVDAAEMGLAPGEWRRFEPAAVTLGERPLAGTLHDAGLAEALALGSALSILPPAIVVFGVQPERVGWIPGLSDTVAAAAPAVCAALRRELGNDD